MKKDKSQHTNDFDADLKAHLAEQEAQLCAKSELIDNMIYQIRTLSNAVIGFSDLLLTEPLSQDQRDYVLEIHDAGLGLSVLAGNVLDWAQVLSGKFQISNAKCSLPDIVRELENCLSLAAQEKGLDYEVMTDPQLPAVVFTDEGRLMKCLVSLTINAIHHTAQGQVRVHVVSEGAGSERCVRFDVIDSGPGMSPEEVRGLFNPSGDILELHEEVRSILGRELTMTASLPMTKILCDLLDGYLDVHSEPGVGSIFSFRIPVDAQTSVPGQTPVARRHDKSSQRPTLPRHILLVEDQQSNRIVISLMLETLGVQVDTAVDGRQALEMADPEKHQLILMDLKMPNMDGYEAAQRLRERGCPIPVLALSAKVLNESEHNQILRYFDGFITKPVDSRQLCEAIANYGKKTPGNDDPEPVLSANAGGSKSEGPYRGDDTNYKSS